VVRELICIALTLYYIILIGRIILSWVPSLPEPLLPIANALRAVTDPLLTPLRNVLPPVRIGVAALDLSPLVLIFGVIILRGLLC
jgi:YggT family protein